MRNFARLKENLGQSGVAPIAAVLAGAFVVGGISGYVMAFFSVQMELAGVATQTIGLASSVQLSAIVLVTLTLPRFVGRMHLPTLCMAACAAGAAAFMGLYHAGAHIGLHLAFRLLLGSGVAVLYIVCELWLNYTVKDEYRGRVLGMYGMLIVLGMGATPLIVPHAGSGLGAYLVGVALFAACLLPILTVARKAPRTAQETTPSSTGILRILKLSPTVTVAGLTFGIAESSMFAFMPVYGLREGLAETQSVFLLTCIFWGGVLMQLPAGWLTDRTAPRHVLLIATGTGVIGGLAAPYLIAAPGLGLWLHMALWGGIVTTIYIIALILLGREHKDADLATATLAFILMYGIGGMAGPSLAGLMMDGAPHGLPWLMALACGVCFVFTLFRMVKGHPR